MHQVHGSRVVEVDDVLGRLVVDADALVTASPAAPRRTTNGAVGRLIANRASRTPATDWGVH